MYADTNLSMCICVLLFRERNIIVKSYSSLKLYVVMNFAFWRGHILFIVDVFVVIQHSRVSCLFVVVDDCVRDVYDTWVVKHVLVFVGGSL